MKLVWWISNNSWTVRVDTEDGIIIEAAPIVRRFLRQPITNLLRWAARFGGLSIAVLREGGGIEWISVPTAGKTLRLETGRFPAQG